MATLTDDDIAEIRARDANESERGDGHSSMSVYYGASRGAEAHYDRKKLLAHNDTKDAIIADQSAQIARMDEALRAGAAKLDSEAANISPQRDDGTGGDAHPAGFMRELASDLRRAASAREK